MELSVLSGSRNINRIFSELGSIWTSVAFTLAAAAACVGLLHRLKILVVRRRSRMYKWGISSSYFPHAVPPRTASADFPDADDVDDSSSCSCDDTEEEEEEEEESDSDSEGHDREQDGELVVGRSASWTREEAAWSGPVVKTWEGLGSERPAGKRAPLSSLSCSGGEFSTAAVRVWKAMAASQGPATEAAAAGHYIPWPALPGSSSSRRRAAVGRDWRSACEETRWDDAGAGWDAEEEEEIRDPRYAGRGRIGSSVVVTWCRNAVSRLPLLPSPNAHNRARPRVPP